MRIRPGSRQAARAGRLMGIVAGAFNQPSGLAGDDRGGGIGDRRRPAHLARRMPPVPFCNGRRGLLKCGGIHGWGEDPGSGGLGVLQAASRSILGGAPAAAAPASAEVGRNGSRHQPEAFDHGQIPAVQFEKSLHALHRNLRAGQAQGPGWIGAEMAIFIEPAGMTIPGGGEGHTPAVGVRHGGMRCPAAILPPPRSWGQCEGGGMGPICGESAER